MERIIFRGPDYGAVQEDDLLVEYLKSDSDIQSGDIVTGTVERIMPGLACAFVNIGRKQNAYLPLKENSMTFTGGQIRSGMKFAVQIRKEETLSKGAYLTRDLTLAGKYVLLMPENRYIGISSRITDKEIRESLHVLGHRLTNGENGIVLREACVRADVQEIKEEYIHLNMLWKNVLERMNHPCANGTVLYHADPVRQMISDYEGKGELKISEVDFFPSNLEKQLRQAAERKIRIPNGGNIIIDRCEAMTVIDVNTGSAYGNDREYLFTSTNLAACEIIAAQIRLRDLAGIILIDFVDMEKEEDRCSVTERLQEYLQRDRRKTVLHGWTNLGLMEMTRKRTGSNGYKRLESDA